MPATALELFEGRTESFPDLPGGKATRETPWVVFDAADEAEALAAVQAEAAISEDGMARISVQLAGRVNATTWRYTASYEELESGEEKKKKESEEDAGGIYSFDTGGGTEHITQSLSTKGPFPPTAAFFNGAIGFDGQRVQGVDITVPVFNFTVDVTLSPEVVTPAYIRKLMDLTGKVNSDPFKVRLLGVVAQETPTWEPGEVLFLGAAGARESFKPTGEEVPTDGRGDWKITLRFSAIPNRKNFSVGDFNVPLKNGWDYLWIAYEDDVDAKAFTRIKKASAVYVEKVYETAAFKDLGLE